jgi:hypothetical protein
MSFYFFAFYSFLASQNSWFDTKISEKKTYTKLKCGFKCVLIDTLTVKHGYNELYKISIRSSINLFAITMALL